MPQKYIVKKIMAVKGLSVIMSLFYLALIRRSFKVLEYFTLASFSESNP